jgi:hypothetical protein
MHRKLPRGGILVFLTGKQEIIRMVNKLRRVLKSRKQSRFTGANDVSVSNRDVEGDNAPREIDDDEVDGEDGEVDDYDEMEDDEDDGSGSDSSQKHTNAVSTKTAVSSSHGNAGSPHLHAKDLEKLALDILSCLLQLLELRDLPVTAEQWTQSVSLCCLLYLPNKPLIRQAAHSTLPQVLGLLVQEKDSKIAAKTWDDLVQCLQPSKQPFQGAFAGCQFDDKDAAHPPSVTLSLELLTTLCKEQPCPKTCGVVVQVLQKMSSIPQTPPLVEKLEKIERRRPKSHGNYLPALDMALKVMVDDAQHCGSLLLLFFSDGAPSDESSRRCQHGKEVFRIDRKADPRMGHNSKGLAWHCRKQVQEQVRIECISKIKRIGQVFGRDKVILRTLAFGPPKKNFEMLEEMAKALPRGEFQKLGLNV